MWSTLISWAAKFGVTTIVKYLGYAVAAAVVVWLWNDYQDLRGENAVLAARVGELAVINAAEVEAGRQRVEQLRADLALQARVAAERQARSDEYVAQIAKLKTIKRRPEYAHCPEVGPAVGAAFGWLRTHAAGPGGQD